MASNFYSNQDIDVEAIFSETNNVVFCSRVHLNDYYYKSYDYDNPFDDQYGECYEEVPAECCDDLCNDSCNEALKDASEDPEMPYENAYQEDIELMKLMGLPTSFGKKFKGYKSYEMYSAYDYDSYEEYEDEENDCVDEYEQNEEYSDINDCGNEDINNTECENIDTVITSKPERVPDSLENSRIDAYEVIKNLKQHTKNEGEFEDFWNLHGYTICLNSWVKKYKDFVSPEYLGISQKCDDLHNMQGKDDKCEVLDNLTTHSEMDQNCETFQGNNSDLVEDSLDFVVKDINDKFQCINFSDKDESKFSNDENVTFDDKTSAVTNSNVEDIGINLENSDIISENIMQCKNVDLTKNEFQTDLLEKVLNVMDFQSIDNVSIKKAFERDSKSSANAELNDSDMNHDKYESVFLPFKENDCDADHECLKKNHPEIIKEKQSGNPLFTCTKPDIDYIQSTETQLTWTELWTFHCEEEYDRFSNFFSENATMLSKYSENDAHNCKFCGEFDCAICNHESRNGAESCSDNEVGILSVAFNAYTKSNFESLSNEIVSCPVIDLSKNIFSLDSESGDLDLIQQDNDGDNEPPLELPIKRSLENESSDDEKPEDTIKRLGFVIRPTNDLKIKKNKRRRRHRKSSNKNKLPQVPAKDEDNQEHTKNKQENEIVVNDASIESEANTNKIVEEDIKIIEESIPIDNKERKRSISDESMEHIVEETDLSQNVGAHKKRVLDKYWHQRYRLFHRFDKGIKLDEESWFSVTPEAIATHVAERCACGVIIDAFCGAGGNAIQFASFCYHVIAIDIDPTKIELAKHNATIYGVADYIDFIVGDYLELAPYLKADGVFLSPPWGGPSYINHAEYNIEKIEPDIYKVFEVSRKISQNIAFFVPKNTIINQLVQLAGNGNSCKIEQNLVNKKVKAITAYYGDFIGHDSNVNEA